MSLNFLVGSYTTSIAHVTFDTATNTFRTTTSAVGPSPTWVEPSRNPKLAGKVFYAVNEMAGKIVSLELTDGKLEVTGMGVTKGDPAHVMALKDGSGVIATNVSRLPFLSTPLTPRSTAEDLQSTTLSTPKQAVSHLSQQAH
jgi:6-phosphogluconolactonase (cycloisomerase 2 family)